MASERAAGGCAFLVCFGALLAIFFALNYPEIRINTVYKLAQCTVTGTDIESYPCCTKTCYGCTSCSILSPSCSTLLSRKRPGYCCGGYDCCRRCCSTCQRCTGSGTKRHCSSYQCNCRCCSSVSEQACQVTCDTCYTGEVFLSYTGYLGHKHSAVVTDSCGTSHSCATGFVAPYQHGNGTYPCWYDPDDFGDVVLHKGYTWWKWFLFAIPALSVLMSCHYATFRLVQRRVKDKSVSAAITLFAWSIILTLFLLVPLYLWAAIPSAGRPVLAAFIVIIPCCGAATGGLGWIVQRSRGGMGSSSSSTYQQLQPEPAIAVVPPNAYAYADAGQQEEWYGKEEQPAQPVVPSYTENGKW